MEELMDEARERRLSAQAKALIKVHGSERVLRLTADERDRDEAAILGERFDIDPEELAAFLKRAADSYVRSRAFDLIRREYASGRKPPPEDEPEGDDPWAEWRAYDDWDPLRKTGRWNSKGRWVPATEWEVLLSGGSAKRNDCVYHLGSMVWAFWEDQPDGRRFNPKADPLNNAGEFLLAVFQAMDSSWDEGNVATVVREWRKERAAAEKETPL